MSFCVPTSCNSATYFDDIIVSMKDSTNAMLNEAKNIFGVLHIDFENAYASPNFNRLFYSYSSDELKDFINTWWWVLWTNRT